jgi:pimeloyl-ACP methyl ester carboxylesterase
LERATVTTSAVPLAIGNSADDRIVKLDYMDRLNYRNLWDGRCHGLPGAGHACFWQTPESFNPLFERFIAEAWSKASSARACQRGVPILFFAMSVKIMYR